jgi:hydrogenase/urease accessory protein HupE
MERAAFFAFATAAQLAEPRRRGRAWSRAMQEQMQQHMKKIVLATAGLIAASVPAFAHADDHQLGVVESLMHLLTEPDHLALIVAAVLAAGVFGLVVRKRRA